DREASRFRHGTPRHRAHAPHPSAGREPGARPVPTGLRGHSPLTAGAPVSYEVRTGSERSEQRSTSASARWLRSPRLELGGDIGARVHSGPDYGTSPRRGTRLSPGVHSMMDRGAPSAPSDPAVFERLTVTRRSVRVYEERDVARELTRALLDLAGRAPSNFNRQPWRFVVADTPRCCA